MERDVCAFVCAQTGVAADFGNCRTLAVLDGDEIAAGIVFHDWQPDRGTLEISGAAIKGGWCSRRLLREAGSYVFGTVGCQMAYARTHEDNRAARVFMRRLGATEIIIPRMRGRTASEALALLTAEAWAQNRLARMP
jgi:RimJ/RimL family protein N-acetyltransferase